MPNKRTKFGVVAGVASIAMLAGCESTGITDADLNLNGTGGLGDVAEAPYVEGGPADGPIQGFGGDGGSLMDGPELGYQGDDWNPAEDPVLGYQEPDPSPAEDPVLGYHEPDPSPAEDPVLGYHEPDPSPADDPVLGYREPDPGPVMDDPVLGYQEPDPGPVMDQPVIGYQEPDPRPTEDPVLGYNGDEPGVVPDVPVEIALPQVSYPYDFSMMNLLGDDAWGEVAANFDSGDLRLVVGELKDDPEISYEIQVIYLAKDLTASAGWFDFSTEGQVVSGHWDLPTMTEGLPDRIVVVEHDSVGQGHAGEEVLVATILFDREDSDSAGDGWQ